MNCFFQQAGDEPAKTYQDLIDDLRQAGPLYQPYCYESSTYRVFRAIIHAWLLGQTLTLLDTDWPAGAIGKQLGDTAWSERRITVPRLDLVDKHELLERLKRCREARLTLYSSGTTGQPKPITHRISRLIQDVRIAPAYAEAVWGTGYHPTHMGSVQVLLQAVLNGAPVVDLHGIRPSAIINMIRQCGVTHLSATPTFYRLLLAECAPMPAVRQVTLGGERVDPALLERLRQVFPGARILNVFASTEAGRLFASTGDVFTVSESMRDKVRITEGRLFIHVALLGESELTSRADDGWYDTGDEVEWVGESPLQFRMLRRSDERINCGGHKVDPGQVESAILEGGWAKAVRVYGRKNTVTGSILYCELIPHEHFNEKALRLDLSQRLPPHAIPRFYQVVDQLATSRAGKLRRDNEA